MRITKSRKFHVSMGNFEWTEFGAEADISSDDFLDRAIAADVEEARVNTDEPKSFIHLYDQENN